MLGQEKIRCTHRAAMLAGRWEPTAYPQLDDWWLDHALDSLGAAGARENEVPEAEQCGFDWDAAEMRSQVGELRRKHPEMLPEPKPEPPSMVSANVIVMVKRKTA